MNFIKSFFSSQIVCFGATESVPLVSKVPETRVFCITGIDPDVPIDPVKDRHRGHDACSLPNALKNWGGFARH
ncbi:hypothetical protein TBK1r_33910 [Stieleria magnilauensis]|uniref:Uncharacterized protein n=1 Tax=Stieleria magnilauensis TaxID=2527963 RepID=A0ABX5XRI2_9BACT|nr:hypothetical protein TBK1r_33910 [Planctomycetes bacterium TBK1r]